MYPRIQRYIEGLLQTDDHFRRFWHHLPSKEQNQRMAIWQLLDDLAKKNIQVLQELQNNAYLETRRWLSVVQETGFSYSRIPDDWTLVAADRTCQRRIYRSNRDFLKRFIIDLGLIETTALYGGLKPYDSIRRKIDGDKHGNSMQRNVLDIWDLIRFRITTSSIYEVIKIGVAIWDQCFDSVLRCRNYYFSPRGGNPEDAYRAVHFELLDRNGAMFELQVMTCYREAISLLDHAPRFKGHVHFIDNEHESWLIRAGYAANIIEAAKEDMTPIEAVLCRIRQ